MSTVTVIMLMAMLLGVNLPTTAHASPAPANVVIDGTVLNGSTPASSIQVAVDCHGQFFGNFIGFVTTNSAGFYTINTTTVLCPIGSTAEVRADQDGDGKFESSAVAPIKTSHVTVNLELGDNVAVPEFGWAGGMAALGVGLGAILLVRKRSVVHGQ